MNKLLWTGLYPWIQQAYNWKTERSQLFHLKSEITAILGYRNISLQYLDKLENMGKNTFSVLWSDLMCFAGTVILSLNSK